MSDINELKERIKFLESIICKIILSDISEKDKEEIIETLLMK